METISVLFPLSTGLPHQGGLGCLCGRCPGVPGAWHACGRCRALAPPCRRADDAHGALCRPCAMRGARSLRDLEAALRDARAAARSLEPAAWDAAERVLSDALDAANHATGGEIPARLLWPAEDLADALLDRLQAAHWVPGFS